MTRVARGSEPGAERATTLQELMERSLARNGPRIALVCGPRTLTYAELERGARGAIGQLRAAGVQAGDHVALLVANGLEYPIYDYAVLRMGAVKVPLNDMLADDDVGYILGHCGARVAVVSPSLERLATAALASAAARAPRLLEAWTPDALLAAEPGAPERVGPGDGAAVFYTGGTTGRPKAVMHGQRGMADNMVSTMLESEIGRDERLLLTTPMPHAAGLFTMAGVLRGATVVITQRFDVAEALAAIAEHRITWTFMVPTMIYRLLDHEGLAEADHASLRTVQYGAAPIDPERLRQGLAALGPVFLQLYGQTECPNFATTLSKADHVRAADEPGLLASCGRAVLMATVTILDEAGAAVAVGDVGEVAIRAPYTMDGYLHDPQASAARFAGPWLRTGDIGALDAAGYLYLKDRRSDMVISGGMNVYSAVVERVVAEAPGVRQAAVIGIPDADWGEAVHAVVTPRDAAAGVDADAVRAFAREHLAGYMAPKSVQVVAELPLTPYGKVDKKRIRATHWAGRERQI